MSLFNQKYLQLTNTKALQLFQLLRQGFLILVAILLAKSHLSQEEVGNYEMLTYLAYLLTFSWVSGAIQALLALYPSLDDELKPTLLFQAFSLFSILTLIVIGGSLFFEESLLTFLFQKDKLSYLFLFCLFLFGNIPASLQEYFYLLQNKPKTLVLFGGISSLLQFLCFAVPIFLKQDFEIVFIALAVLGLLKWLWVAVFSFRFGKISFDLRPIKAWWRLAWPLIIYAFIGALNISVGPWFVGFFSNGDEAQFAVFRYGARELPLLTALAGALSSSLIPMIAADKTQGLVDLKQKSAHLYHILFPVSIVLMLTSQWWFVWVFGHEYVQAVPVFNTFLLTVIAHMIFTRTVLVALHDTQWIPFAAVFGVLVNVLSCWLLGQYLGLVGIAMATVIAFVFEKFVLTIFLRKRHDIKLIAYSNVSLWLTYSVILTVVYLWIF